MSPFPSPSPSPVVPFRLEERLLGPESLNYAQFEMNNGCYRGESCICNGNGNICRRKGVVYKAVCQSCEEFPRPTYVGETARQAGQRTAEHINKLSLLKKDSFMVQHWMECHSVDTIPPKFKFRIISQHKEALTRQIREAVCIREMGSLNKKNEFALNELIRMESSIYSWDQAAADKDLKKSEALRDIHLSDFINVMAKINSNKCVSDVPNTDCCNYRLKSSKRKVLSDNIRGEKRRRMFSSTPQPHRQPAPVVSSPENSPIKEVNASDNSEGGSNDTGTCTGRTGLSRDTEQIQVDVDRSPETLVEQLAKQVVTVDSFNQAEEDFQHRISLDPKLLEMVTVNT